MNLGDINVFYLLKILNFFSLLTKVGFKQTFLFHRWQIADLSMDIMYQWSDQLFFYLKNVSKK